MTEPTWQIDQLLGDIEQAYHKEGIGQSWLHEKKAILDALQRISKCLPSRRYLPKSVLGVGGSGIVIRLSDQLFPITDIALKFPRPVPGKVELIAEMLAKEMGHLSELRDPGIVRIVFYTTLDEVESYGSLPFYLMEAVDGVRSSEYVLHPDTKPPFFLRLVSGTARLLRYLHQHPTGGFAHLDLKPDNIVAKADGSPVMIDLGTCKRLRHDGDPTTIACTRSYAHPELVRRLLEDPSDERRSKGTVPRVEINPKWDLWSYGVMLLEWLGIDYGSGSVRQNAVLDKLDTYTRKYLVLLSARLLSDALPAWLIKKVGLSSEFLKSFALGTAEELVESISRIDGGNRIVDQIPELAVASSGNIQAAPDANVPTTERLSEILGHRLFRRLNTITQLGLVSQVYPGARHARREHSLGTYANTGRVLKALWNDSVSPLFRQIITEADCRDVLVTALLHDLGQFPLAHDLEEIDNKLFDHAALTQAMLKGQWAKKKKGSKNIEFESFEAIFKMWDTTADRIIAILNAKATSTVATPKAKLLRSIISGPIDADKLDYLSRDSRYLNLPYPEGIDVAMIFRCLTTVVIDKIEGGTCQ